MAVQQTSHPRFLSPATALSLTRLVLLPVAGAAPVWRRQTEPEPKSPEDASLWIYLSIAIVLVLTGGTLAGLTIAFMGQDETFLEVQRMSADTPQDQKSAAKVLKTLKKGKHWVLVTLLLGNTITNETLPIVLDRSIGGGWPAVLSSTALIVIFGEIVPQSICVRHGLTIGAIMSPFVCVLMWLLAPVAWPTAKLLDYLLGEDHGTMYKKAGLKTLVGLHKTLGTSADRLKEDEVKIIQSVLDLKDKPVGRVMTPIEDVYTLSVDAVLNEKIMDEVLEQGYSRIPVHATDKPTSFIGMLLVKTLITYDPEDCKRVSDFALATLPETQPDTSCLDILNYFQEGKSHMVLVSEQPGTDNGVLGVVTLEDVIEELIGEEIVDESDVFIDVHKAIRRLAPADLRRYKMKAGQLVEDVDDEDTPSNNEQTPLLNKQRPPGAPLIRRQSGKVIVSEQLRHLGPSNAASRPKPTKYANVKIKPGVEVNPHSGSEVSVSFRDERPLPVIKEPEGSPRDSGEEGDDALGDLPPSRDRSSQAQARSGSITETTVDVGGVKKIVLELNGEDEVEIMRG